MKRARLSSLVSSLKAGLTQLPRANVIATERRGEGVGGEGPDGCGSREERRSEEQFGARKRGCGG